MKQKPPCGASAATLARSHDSFPVGYVVPSLRDSQHYSMSALRLREYYEASLFPELLDIRTLLGRMLALMAGCKSPTLQRYEDGAYSPHPTK